MTEQRKPIFGFLWPAQDPHAPVDGAYRQVRRLRITSRGPLRLLVLVGGSIVVVIMAGTIMLAAVTAQMLVPTIVGAVVVASGTALVLRGWVVGTFVDDTHLTIETMFRRRVVPWPDVVACTTVAEPSPLAGLPLRVPSSRTIVRLADGEVLRTHVYATSPDLCGRAEAFDMARLRLERWGRAS